MRLTVRAVLPPTVLLFALAGARAQSLPNLGDEANDDPRGNVHLGTPLVIPIGDTAKAVHVGYGLNVGGGYNFTRRHAAIADFTWNHMIPTNEALAAIRAALSNPNLNANTDVYAITGNYRFEMRGQTAGGYLIGGGGLYTRRTSLTQQVTTGGNIVCQPIYQWWGFTCSSGTVTSNQTLAHFSSSSGGGNVGAGFTARVGEAPYRVFIEARYHYAPNKYISTQLIDISFGIRY